MKNLTAAQIRTRLGKCVDSFDKKTALADLYTAGIAMTQGDPITADALRARAQYHLRFAEETTRRARDAR